MQADLPNSEIRVAEKPIAPMRIKASPFAHQVCAFNYTLRLFDERQRKGIALLCDMGTGKTITSIAIAANYFAAGKVRRLLVVAPKSIVGVWQEEFSKFADIPYNLAILEGTGWSKADTLRNLTGSALQVAVVNYESLWRMETDMAKWKPDFIICDESSKIKNPQAKQAKALHRLGKNSRYNAILTGTPVTNNPLDFFSQYKFLDESIFGASFFIFRNRYAVIGGFQNHDIVGYKNMPELVTKAHSVAFRIRIGDAVDLPDKIDEIRNIELEPSARKIYKSINRDLYAELIHGSVVTNNILTKLLRLAQCVGGFIRDDTSGIIQQVSSAKLNALEDIIDTCIGENKKVVVFARFVPEIDAIEKLVKSKKIDEGKNARPLGFSLFCGATKDRAEQVRRFQEDDDVRVFVGQLQTTGMGLTLTAASVAVFYSKGYNRADYDQARGRIYRIGQTQKCLYIHLNAKDSVDEMIMAALKKKGDIAKLVVDDYKKLL